MNTTPYTEYVVWGCNKGETEEKLLLANVEGKPITNKAIAEKGLKLLGERHGCHSMRIQTIEFSDKGMQELINVFKPPA